MGLLQIKSPTKFVGRNHFRDPSERFFSILQLILDEEVSDGFQDIILCHYPMVVWDKSHRGSWQLFGHVHGMLDGDKRLSPNQMDIGVDSNNFRPISYQEVKEIITINNLDRIKNGK